MQKLFLRRDDAAIFEGLSYFEAQNFRDLEKVVSRQPYPRRKAWIQFKRKVLWGSSMPICTENLIWRPLSAPLAPQASWHHPCSGSCPIWRPSNPKRCPQTKQLLLHRMCSAPVNQRIDHPLLWHRTKASQGLHRVQRRQTLSLYGNEPLEGAQDSIGNQQLWPDPNSINDWSSYWNEES